jgi:hypothetical protein
MKERAPSEITWRFALDDSAASNLVCPPSVGADHNFERRIALVPKVAVVQCRGGTRSLRDL